MVRIGIIGCENSHADGLARIFNEEKKFEGFAVTAVSGHYKEENQKIKDKYDIPQIYDNFEDMAGQVDAVVITARDGKYHAGFARPFIDAGLPVYIDKPFTIDIGEAEELIARAEKSGSRICGGSYLKYLSDVMFLKNEVLKGGVKGGMVAAPLIYESPHSGFYFYASHLSEISLEIFGENPVSLIAVKNNNNISVLVNYKDYCVTNCFANLAYKSYMGVIIGREGNVMRQLDCSGGLSLAAGYFVDMVKTGNMIKSYRQLIVPVYYMNAVYESYMTGKEIFFDKYYKK